MNKRKDSDIYEHNKDSKDSRKDIYDNSRYHCGRPDDNKEVMYNSRWLI